MAAAPTTKSQSRARILLVDDHPVIRGGLIRLLSKQPDLECCGEAGTAPEALTLAREQKPDLAIVDLRLKHGDGLELIKALRAEQPTLKTLVLSQHTERVYVERALRAGAQGYVAKEQDPADLLQAVRTILAGQVYLTYGLAADLLQASLARGTDEPESAVRQLSDRELVVLNLLGEGKSTKQIAAVLGLSFKTVETHRENIKRKLNLSDAASLVEFANRWAAKPAAVPLETFNRTLKKPGE